MSWRPDDASDESKRLRASIEQLLDRKGHGELTLLARITDVWTELVGEHVASHVRPAAILEDTLFVDVDQPAWSTEVTFLSQRLLASLEERLQSHVASRVKARVRGGSGVE